MNTQRISHRQHDSDYFPDTQECQYISQTAAVMLTLELQCYNGYGASDALFCNPEVILSHVVQPAQQKIQDIETLL